MDLDAVRRGAEAPVLADARTASSAAADLAAAFVDDPIFNWFMRTDGKRDAARGRMFELLVREMALPDGEVERPEAGGAAAVWLSSDRAGPQPLSRELRALPTLLNATGLARFSRLAGLRGLMEEHHPMDRPHDYLQFLGVHPNAQGAGVGSRLLGSRTKKLDARQRCAFLETGTPRNVPLYQRFGFRIIAEYTPQPDGPLIWAMWRDPQPPA